MNKRHSYSLRYLRVMGVWVGVIVGALTWGLGRANAGSELSVTVRACPDPGKILVTATIPRDAGKTDEPLTVSARIRSDLPQAQAPRVEQPALRGVRADLVLDAESVPAGTCEIDVVLATASDVIATDTATLDWPGRSEAFRGIRILNNFVWELLAVEAGATEPIEGTYRVRVPWDRWLFIRSVAAPSGEGRVTVTLDADGHPIDLHEHAVGLPMTQEAMRRVTAGEHTVTVTIDGDAALARLEVRAVPELQHSRYPTRFRHLHPGVDYDWAWLGKHILPHVNTLITTTGTLVRSEVGEIEGFDDRVHAWRDRGGKWIVYTNRPGLHGRPEIEESVEDIYRLYKGDLDWGWRTPRGYSNPYMDGVLVDEFYHDQDEAYPRFAEAIRKLNADPELAGNAFYPYAAGHFGKCEASVDMARAAIEGGGTVAWEAYISAFPTLEDGYNAMRRYADRHILPFEDQLPGLIRNTIWVPGAFSYPWPLADGYAHVHFAAYLDMQMHMIATRPDLFGLGGVHIWHAGYVDEELMRRYGLMFRHYGIEGRTDRFRDEPYLLTHIRNPDFAEGSAGWDLAPASPGSVTPGELETFGRFLGRYYRGPDTFLAMARTPERPNVVSQTVTGLEPGALYSVKMLAGDYGALRAGIGKEELMPLSVEVEGADLLEGPRYGYQQAYPRAGSWWRRSQDRQTAMTEAGNPLVAFAEADNPFWFTYYWQVFRATGPTETLRITDRTSAGEYGDPAVEQVLITFVEVKPYEDEPEVEAIVLTPRLEQKPTPLQRLRNGFRR